MQSDHYFCYSLMPNKNISVFQVTGLKTLGRVGTHFYLFFSGPNIILCILKGILPFKMHTIILFPENLNIGSGYPKHRYFFSFGLIMLLERTISMYNVSCKFPIF